jgi:hypothetical protein
MSWSRLALQLQFHIRALEDSLVSGIIPERSQDSGLLLDNPHITPLESIEVHLVSSNHKSLVRQKKSIRTKHQSRVPWLVHSPAHNFMPFVFDTLRVLGKHDHTGIITSQVQNHSSAKFIAMLKIRNSKGPERNYVVVAIHKRLLQ